MIRIIFLSVYSIVFLIGCDLSGDPEDQLDFNPVFEANVTGEYDLNIAGRATYAYFTEPESNRRGAVIQLVTVEPYIGAGRGIGFTGRLDIFEERRDYEIVGYRTGDDFIDLEEDTFFVLYVHGDHDPEYSTYFNGRSGALTIDEIEGNRLSGSFAFTAAGLNTVTRDTVELNVSGWFDALQGELDL